MRRPEIHRAGPEEGGDQWRVRWNENLTLSKRKSGISRKLRDDITTLLENEDDPLSEQVMKEAFLSL